MIHMAADSGSVLYESVAFAWREILDWIDGRLAPCRHDLVLPALSLARAEFATVHGLARRSAWCCAALIEASVPELAEFAGRVCSHLDEADVTDSFGAARQQHVRLASMARDDVFALVDAAREVASRGVAVLPASFDGGSIDRSLAPAELSLALVHLLGLVECPAWDAERLVERLVDHGLALREEHRFWLLAGLRNDLNPNAVWDDVRQFPLPDRGGGPAGPGDP
jgi:hypothetical protein